VVFDDFKPDRFDLIGAAICLLGRYTVTEAYAKAWKVPHTKAPPSGGAFVFSKCGWAQPATSSSAGWSE
jgi:hypothetical protein